ncbi:(2Fe-2S)-binding protein [Streptomyces sp. KK5PA1]|uniref:(2Fe-2S)-binding protein n=1 Tax=Actinacidiphila acididurans TaxID=2784346 RepID=A0ABS2U034_9ACTN|nr:(2Fe-2S)-binding protein [Actinacidiphila acididurans]
MRAVALRTLAAGGPYFTCEAHETQARPHPGDGDWRPLDELIRDPHALPARVADVRGHLAAAAGRPPGEVDVRAAASVAHLGLVARTISPLIALAALHPAPYVPSLGEMRWQPRPGGAFPLSLPAAAFTPTGASPTVTAALIVDRLAAPWVARVAELSVSRRTLWGNVASAVNGAGVALGAALPGQRDRIAATVSALLDLPALRGSHEPGAYGRDFRRRSCCLIYRAAPGPVNPAALCGDCVLGRR